MDDGGDATLLIHEGMQGGEGCLRSSTTRRERGKDASSTPLADGLLRSPALVPIIAQERSRACPRRPPPACTGSTRWQSAGELLFPAINVNDSVTKTKFDNLYGCRESLVDGIKRATDVMIAGKIARGLRLRRRGQGLRPVAARPRAPGRGHRDRPDLRPAGRHGGLPGGDHGRGCRKADIFVTATGNCDVITGEHMAKMKDQAIVCNIGHFDNEIDVAEPAASDQWENIKPQVDHIIFPDGKRIILLAEGPPGEPGLRHRPPELRDDQQLHQPDAGPDRAVAATRASTRTRSTCCPSSWTRKWRACTWSKIGVKLTTLTAKQADYIGVPVDGPYKPDHYRY